ncbi:MAG: hypothetical protein FJ387_18605 [Verrucomicrobia bacterium]|nr:hypothetical protein [Verrucomicrobiota bacterium]
MPEAISIVLAEAVRLVNLPLTLLLILVVLYWLLVILGGVDAAVHGGHIELDAGHVEGGHGDLGHAEPGAAGHGHGEGLEGAGAHGWGWVLSFLHLGQVPATAVFSVLTLCLWTFSLLGNFHFNAGYHLGLAAALLLPNLLVSVVLTHFLVLPLKPLFRMLNKDYDAAAPIIGQICEVATGHADAHFGQANISTRGAPITIQVRAAPGEVLRRGQKAMVVGRDEQHGFYEIRKYDEPQLEQ